MKAFAFPLLRIVLVWAALAAPAFAQDGANGAAAASEAADQLHVYLDWRAAKFLTTT